MADALAFADCPMKIDGFGNETLRVVTTGLGGSVALLPPQERALPTISADQAARRILGIVAE
jgi:hypothetical protein